MVVGAGSAYRCSPGRSAKSVARAVAYWLVLDVSTDKPLLWLYWRGATQPATAAVEKAIGSIPSVMTCQSSATVQAPEPSSDAVKVATNAGY